MNNFLEHETVVLGEPPISPSVKVLTTSDGRRFIRYRGPREIVTYFLSFPNVRIHDAGTTMVAPVCKEVVMALEILGQLEEADDAYVAAVRELLQPSNEALSYYPPSALEAPEPRPHQLSAFGWALDGIFGGRKGFVNASVLGSGKTRMAIDLMRHFVRSHALVIGQKTTLEQWVEQLQIAWPEAETHVLHQVGRGTLSERKEHLAQINQATWSKVRQQVEQSGGDGRNVWTRPQVVLVNWEALGALEKDLKKLPKFDLIVADEASRLLGRTTAMARAAKALAWKHAWYAVAMTGTPIRRSVEDLLALFQFADSSVFGPRIADFRERYCDEVWDSGRPTSVPKPERVVDLVTRFYSAGFRVSRAAVDMPEPERRIVRLQPSREQTEQLGSIDQSESADAANVLTRVLRQQQVTAGFVMAPHNAPAAAWDCEHEEILRPRYLDNPKVDWIIRYLEEAWETEDGKFLVWTRFIPEIAHLHQRLVDRWGSAAVARMDGSTPDARRQEIRRAVNDRSNPLRVLACNLQTGAMGLDLPGIDVMLYHSSTFNYVDRVQSEGRGTRLGRTKPCQMIDLVLTGTIDEHIADVLAKKQSVNDLLVGQGFVRQFQGAR